VKIASAFTFAFDDREWLSKLGLTFLITAVSILFTPVIVGLLGWALLLGYQERLVHNVRRGDKFPLPRWENFNDLLSRGFNVLGALVFYNIPNILLSCCLFTLSGGLGAPAYTSAITTIGIACCLFPLILLYNLIVWPLIALGMGHYNESGKINAFFQIGELFALLREHMDATIQYVMWSVLASLLLSLLNVTLIGIVATWALWIPVQGMLIAQYLGLALPKMKAKPQPQRK
jgi:hypothetical protein